MGGKKKSLTTKLAKMSDEERARYLQYRADIEEEAKRRKEQLISTFMKVNCILLGDKTFVLLQIIRIENGQ